MADNIQQKFTNTYIDKTVGMVHEYVSMVIQLRTQLQLANDLIAEKDQVISTLQNERESALSEINEESEKIKSKSDNLSQELNAVRESAKTWEAECNAMRNKVAHMDSLTNQLNEMKQGLIVKNEELNRSNQRISDLEKHIVEVQALSSDKDDTIENLNKTIESLQTVTSPKKVINSKKSKTISPIEETDDF